jgi:hypothetical protein
MKRFLIAISFVALFESFAAGEAFAAPLFSWFHTRPKPVLLTDNGGTRTPKKVRVQYRGTAMYPGSGRLYFEDQRDKGRVEPASQSRSHMSTIFSRGWNGDSAKASSGKAAQGK